MSVETAGARFTAEHEGRTVYFCCEGCRRKFVADPGRYDGSAAGVAHPAPPAPAGTVYTCPMHPEVRAMAPGPCPKCGMALEPETPAGDDTPDVELAEMTRRLSLAVAPAAVVLLVAMGSSVAAGVLGTPRMTAWLELLLASPVVLWAGYPLFARAASSVVHRSPNMFTLIGLGAGAAYGVSAVATVAPGIFPAAFRDASGSVPVYFETAAVIVVFALLGQVLELRARRRTGRAVRALVALAPKLARRVTPAGGDEDVPLEVVARGDRLRVRPGERIPCDGTVTEGASAVDESAMTGEAMPVEKSAGTKVIGGTLNTTGTFVMRADRVGRDTMLAHAVDLVARAQRSQPPVQRLADRVSAVFVPAVLVVAVATFAAWAAFGPEPRWSHALLSAIAVVVIACPCALGLATPMSILVGVGRGAAIGVLFKDAATLEKLARIDTVAFDKTGTVTYGKPRVVDVVADAGFSPEQVLRFAAALERGSEHPLASAILARAEGEAPQAARFRAVAGRGVTGSVDDRECAVGNEALARELAGASPLFDRAESLRQHGRTVAYVVVDRRLAALLVFADELREGAREAVAALQADGLRCLVLTGDARTSAVAVARQLGVDEVEAELMPADKAERVAKLQAAGRLVAMAGDGINDAPALAAASVGIAVGTAVDVAAQSAGVLLVRPDLGRLVDARALSRATMGNIRQNLALAFIYNVVALPVAAGVLYPAFGWTLRPMIASAAMSLSSVSVIANALRLRAWQPPERARRVADSPAAI